jgi:hypothetical protein
LGNSADEHGGDSKHKDCCSDEDDDKNDKNTDGRATKARSAAHGLRGLTKGVSSSKSDALDMVSGYAYDCTRDQAHAEVRSASTKRVFDFVLFKTKGNSIQDNWYSVVSDYSACQLTFAEDKLPTLSGIASRCQRITQDECLAGHWRFNLVQSLFWIVGAQASRVKPYRAPSWSWASTDGTVIAPQLCPIDDDDQGIVRLLDAWVKIDGDNPFGRVIFG